MTEVLQALYEYFRDDDGKDVKGNYLDDYQHITYKALLGATAANFHKHFVPSRQPQLLKDNVPVVAFYTVSMPPHNLAPIFNIITVEFDIYTDDPTLFTNTKIAQRHYQLLQEKIIPTPVTLPYLGKWHHQTEMQLLLNNPNFFCYAQRFIVAVKREFSETKRKK